MSILSHGCLSSQNLKVYRKLYSLSSSSFHLLILKKVSRMWLAPLLCQQFSALFPNSQTREKEERQGLTSICGRHLKLTLFWDIFLGSLGSSITENLLPTFSSMWAHDFADHYGFLLLPLGYPVVHNPSLSTLSSQNTAHFSFSHWLAPSLSHIVNP